MLLKPGILLICILIGICWADENDVLELNDENFDAELRRRDNSLVMFYAPWCGHCKQMKPEYSKAAGPLKEHDIPITLIKVDCTDSGSSKTCSDFGISGYPTLKIFSKNEVVKDYQGPREASGIIQYMKSQVGPASIELLEDAMYERFLKSSEVYVIGFFEKYLDDPLSTAFDAVSKKLREKVKFGHTSAKALLEKSGFKNQIVLHRPKMLHNKFEPHHVVFEGTDSVAEIQEFINNNYFGLVGIRTPDNAGDFKKPLIVAYYNVDYVKNPKGTNYWRNRILKVAKNYPSSNFAISSLDNFQHELSDFGVGYSKGDKPIILARDDKNQKFILKDEFSVEKFEEFLKDMEAGKLEPYLKSEAIPEDNTGHVKVAVAKNFDEVVTNNGKDTLIEFYAPWCGHCKKLAPVYDELAEKLADEEVAIVKLDATANDVPALYDVKGFPTLFWVPKNSKDSPVKYEGGRDVDDFLKYISKHSTDGLKGYDRQGKPVETKTEL